MAACCSLHSCQAGSFATASLSKEEQTHRASSARPESALQSPSFSGQELRADGLRQNASSLAGPTPSGLQLVATAVSKRIRCAAAASAEVEVAAAKASDVPVTSQLAKRPTAAELGQTVVELAVEGTLVTLAHGGTEGSSDGQALPATWPLATHAFFALDPEGRPIVLLRDGSRAAANLAADSQACLHVQIELPGQQKPQCSLHGRLQKAVDVRAAQNLEAAWRRRFPDAAAAVEEGAGEARSSLYLLDVDRVHVAADADDEGAWMAADDFLEAEADPLREVASGIVDDFNREHWQDLRRFPAAFADVDVQVEEASMTWVDRLGFDLRVLARPLDAVPAGNPPQLLDLRIGFPHEVVEEREARSAITMMAQVAWEKERSYVPPIA